MIYHDRCGHKIDSKIGNYIFIVYYLSIYLNKPDEMQQYLNNFSYLKNTTDLKIKKITKRDQKDISIYKQQ